MLDTVEKTLDRVGVVVVAGVVVAVDGEGTFNLVAGESVAVVVFGVLLGAGELVAEDFLLLGSESLMSSAWSMVVSMDLIHCHA